MRRLLKVAAAGLAASVLAGATAGGPPDLARSHRQWLEQDAAYLIGPKEREVFLSLSTDRQRELFIQAFWKQRDPTPDTEANEFREEHYRRMSYADAHFGRSGILPGWKTDRGRVHIILGPPQQGFTYDRQAEVVPVQVWFYQGLSRFGLPDAFSCVFFKPDPASDFMLYSPVGDGPARLLRTGGLDPADHLSAYARLRQAEPDVARVSLSLIAAEEGEAQSPSLASQALLDNISQVPLRTVDAAYALRFRKYSDFVEVEHSAKAVASRALAVALPDPSGLSFVHYAIEPARLSVEEAGDRLETVLETVGRVTDGQGRTVFQFERKTPVSLDRAQAKTLRSRPISVQGVFPLAEGVYDLTLILKNTASREFTTVEEKLSVPARSVALSAPTLLIAYASRDEPVRREMKAFRFGRVQLFVSSLVEFRAGDRVWPALRLAGSAGEMARIGSVRFEILDEAGATRSVRTAGPPPADGSEPAVCSFDLQGLPVGDYRIRASVLDPDGRTILERSARFGLTAVIDVPRPLVFSDPMPEAGSGAYAYLLGGQYFNLGDLARAESFSRGAWLSEPSSSRYALGLARVLLAESRYAETRDILEPFTSGGTAEASALEFMAEACRGLGDHARAVRAYEEYLARFGVKLSVLNGLGGSCLVLGETDRARTAFERSLEIAPGQDEVRRALAAIKK